MAPGSYQNDFTAQNLNNVQLPKTLPCSCCKKYLSPTMFSKKHQSAYRFQKGINRNFTPHMANSKYKCRTCTGGQTQELKCEGQCSLWKPLGDFSKNQRSGERWCKECVLWKTSQEPGGVVQAGPGHDLAQDEDYALYGNAVYDIEEGDDSDDYEQSDVASSMAKLSINSAKMVNSSNTISSQFRGSNNGPAGQASVLPHLRGFNNGSALSFAAQAPASFTSASPTPSSDYLPPHLRGKVGGDIASTSSVSNPYQRCESFASSSRSTVVGQAIPFNAYDPNGQPHLQYRMPSGSTTVTPPDFAIAVPTAPDGPASRPQPVARPQNRPSEKSLSSAVVTQAVEDRGNWVRVAGGRNVPLHKDQIYEMKRPITQVPRRSGGGFDSDGSADEM